MTDKERPRRGQASGVDETEDAFTVHLVTELVYLDASKKTSKSLRFRRADRTVKDLFPDAGIIQPIRDAYDADTSLAVSRTLLRRASIFVFITEPDGTIGTGILAKIVDAVFSGLPVALLTDEQDLIQIEDVSFRFLDDRTPDRVAQLIPQRSER